MLVRLQLGAERCSLSALLTTTYSVMHHHISIAILYIWFGHAEGALVTNIKVLSIRLQVRDLISDMIPITIILAFFLIEEVIIWIWNTFGSAPSVWTNYWDGVTYLSTALQFRGQMPIAIKPIGMLFTINTFYNFAETHCARTCLVALCSLFLNTHAFW